MSVRFSFRVPVGVLVLGLALAVGCGSDCARAAEKSFLRLGTTTTTENSGLMSHLVPRFEAETGITVRVVVHGTGQILRTAKAGDVDVFLAHDTEAERAFVAGGDGSERRDVMYNHFVVVGPTDDPAKVRGIADAAAALTRIAEARAPFVSRGDDSGTHRAERRLWRDAGIDPTGASGKWYLEAGAGMGTTLNIAAGKGAYTLTDRGTWLSFRNRRGLAILSEGDPRLLNQYGVTLVNPVRHDHVNATAARAFLDWVTSEKGRRAIADYRVDGEQLFFPGTPRPQS